MNITRFGRTQVAALFGLTVGIMLVCYETIGGGEAIEDMTLRFTGRPLGIVGAAVVLASLATLVVIRRLRHHTQG